MFVEAAPDNETAFMCATSVEVWKLFLNQDKKLLGFKNSQGNTPLCFARNAEIVTLLVKSGASIEEKNDAGETPLVVLMNDSRWKSAIALIESGANKNVKVNGESLLEHLALLKGSIEKKIWTIYEDQDYDQLVKLLKK